jgi:hypothetical protein
MAEATRATPPARDLQAERDSAEFAGWAEAQGYGDDELYSFAEMEETFMAGMQAARDLAAVTGYGTLAERVTRLAETWENHPQLTEEGQLLRELGEILRDELHHASDRPGSPS